MNGKMCAGLHSPVIEALGEFNYRGSSLRLRVADDRSFVPGLVSDECSLVVSVQPVEPTVGVRDATCDAEANKTTANEQRAAWNRSRPTLGALWASSRTSSVRHPAPHGARLTAFAFRVLAGRERTLVRRWGLNPDAFHKVPVRVIAQDRLESLFGVYRASRHGAASLTRTCS